MLYSSLLSCTSLIQFFFCQLHHIHDTQHTPALPSEKGSGAHLKEILLGGGSILMPFCRSAIDRKGGAAVFFPCASGMKPHSGMTWLIVYFFNAAYLAAAAPYILPIIELKILTVLMLT